MLWNWKAYGGEVTLLKGFLKKMAKHDWSILESEFMGSNLSQVEFAKEKGIAENTLVNQAVARNWVKKRHEIQRRAIEKANLRLIDSRSKALARHARIGRLFQVKAGRAFLRRKLDDTELVSAKELADIAEKGVRIESEAIGNQELTNIPGGLILGAEIKGIDGSSIRIMAQAISRAKTTFRESGQPSLGNGTHPDS